MTKRLKVPEKVEQQRIVTLLRSLGASVYVLGHPSPADGRRFRGTGQTPGVPDLYAFLPPRNLQTRCPVWIEVKAHGGRLRPEQKDFANHCLFAGHAHIVGGLDAVIAWLQGAGYLHGAPAHTTEAA